MTLIISTVIIGLFGLLFATMALAPIIIEALAKDEAQRGQTAPVSLNSSPRPSTGGYGEDRGTPQAA